MRVIAIILVAYFTVLPGMFGFYGDAFGFFSEGRGMTTWALIGHGAAALTIICDQAAIILRNVRN